MTWEYFEEDMRAGFSLDRLNERGDEGWELCATVGSENGTRLIYKRARPVFVQGHEPAHQL